MNQIMQKVATSNLLSLCRVFTRQTSWIDK